MARTIEDVRKLVRAIRQLLWWCVGEPAHPAYAVRKAEHRHSTAGHGCLGHSELRGADGAQARKIRHLVLAVITCRHFRRILKRFRKCYRGCSAEVDQGWELLSGSDP